MIVGCLARAGDGGSWADGHRRVMEIYLHLDLDGRCLDCWRDGFGKMGFNPSGFGVVEEGAAVVDADHGRQVDLRWGRWVGVEIGFNPSALVVGGSQICLLARLMWADEEDTADGLDGRLDHGYLAVDRVEETMGFRQWR
ncbi:hypothetical protein ACLOJK_014682 [Asimina triloba]